MSRENTDVQGQTKAHTAKEIRRETRKVITPYAFGVAPELIGTPLASPIRRGIAILVDLCVISLLATSVAEHFLWGAFAWMFYRARTKLKHQTSTFLSALLLVCAVSCVVVFSVLITIATLNIIDGSQGSTSSAAKTEIPTSLSGMQALQFITKSSQYTKRIIMLDHHLNDGTCASPMACWQPIVVDLAKDLAAISFTKAESLELVQEILNEKGDILSTEEKETLISEFNQHYRQHRPEEYAETKAETGKEKNAEQSTGQIDTQKTPLQKGIIETIKHLAADLGISFGWAAFYFTVFTAWWRGQTLGKRLLGICVIRLDGQTPTLWESFGRYGGYGAGFATGLLGFGQVFWDANRQGIQDKIAETLVIRYSQRDDSRDKDSTSQDESS